MRKIIVLLTVIGAILFLFVASAVAQDKTPIQLTQQQATATAAAAGVYQQETTEAFGLIQQATATAEVAEAERKIAEEVALLASYEKGNVDASLSAFAAGIVLGFVLAISLMMLMLTALLAKKS